MSDPVPLRPENFKALVRERINDPVLRRNVVRATATSLVKRSAVVADYPAWEEMRAEARRIRTDVLEHLPAMLERFETAAAARGTHVWYASTAAEACEQVVSIILERGGRSVVKSKSMVTEEIGLNHALADAGIDVVETDLGEYIIQLAGEMPSHITAPALHKSREEIGRLFSEKLGIPYTSDPEQLTATARAVLRDRFLQADVGITGANFVVAETGAVCIVENEGNARMATSLPRLHVAVTGLEKFVPDMASLAHLLSMLARSATGQRITSYTSVIAGPRTEAEMDGPDEMHVVILDNGRAEMLADPVLNEALLCIRCGACMNVCPVYQKIGGHAYGSIYSGPIGSVLTPVFAGLERARDLPYASSLCGACSEICPVRIDIHHLLLHHRREIVGRGIPSFMERIVIRAFGAVMRRPALYRAVARLASLAGALLGSDGRAMRVPIWSRSREFQAIPAKSFRDLWKERDDGQK